MSIKTDRAVKERATRLAHEIGIPLGTIMNAYLRQFAVSGEVRFDVPLRPTKYLRDLIEESRQDKSKRKPLSYEAFIKELHS